MHFTLRARMNLLVSAPHSAAQSYLNVNAIIDACKKTGANAVHPGYGFLSEDTNFGKQLNEANIEFIGPRTGSD